MPTLLSIEASPRGAQSRSAAIARRYLDRLKAAAPGLAVDYLDIWNEALPDFSGLMIDAKYAILGGRDHTPEQAAAWGAITTQVDRLRAADHLLIATPMWNLSIPYRLKHYIDIVTQPGLTFSFSPAKGYAGLLTGKTATLIYASSGDYRPGSGNPRPDYQKPFLEAWLRFVGVTDVKTVAVEPTLGDPAAVTRGQTEAEQRAERLAEEFIAWLRPRLTVGVAR